MSGTPQKHGQSRRKAQLAVQVPSLAPDGGPEWKAEARLHPRRSSASAAGSEKPRWRARARLALTLLGALFVVALLFLRWLYTTARDRPPLPTVGLPAADEQRCCGSAPCERPFVAPIIKASRRDRTVLESLACAWLPAEGGFQLTLVWTDEVMPRSGLGIGLKDKLYRAMRLLRYGRLRDIESVVLYPGEPEGPPLKGVWFPGTFSHQSSFAVNKHFSARIPGELLSFERGRAVLYSRTWNHLSHFRPEQGPDGQPVPQVSYEALPAVAASRSAVEARHSVALPWKAAESGGARKSNLHTILFEPPELSTDEVLDEEDAQAEERQRGEQAAAAGGAAAAEGLQQGAPPRRAGGQGAPPRRRRGARVRSFGARLHRWLWGLGT